MRVRDKDIKNTTCHACYEHYEFVLMSFVLINAPSAFMNLLNRVCRIMLDQSVIVLIDNILFFSKTKDHHKEHLREVLDTLQRESLYAMFSNNEFWLRKVKLIRHLVNKNGMLVDLAKIEVVMQWEILKSPSEIQTFLGLSRYYIRFIQEFSKIAIPLTR